MPNSRNYTTTLKGQGTWTTASNPTGATVTRDFMHADRTGSDYSRRKPIGRWLPPTNYSMSETSWKVPSGTWSYRVNAANNGRETGVLPFHSNASALVSAFHTESGIPASFPSDLANRALINARNNLKDTSLDLGVAFGERRETARFVGDTLSLMGDFASALWDFRKGKVNKDVKKKLKKLFKKTGGRNSYESFKKIPSLRLQYQYAVKPLMSDIYNSVTALEDHSRDSWKVTVKGKANFKAKGGRNILQTQTRDQSRCDYDILYGCMVRLDVQPGNDALRKASQLGFTNPVNLAWELLPLSFVVDWAYPLGDYFASLDALVGWELLGCSTSSFTKKVYKFQGTKTSVGATQILDANWNASYRTVSLNRGVSSSVPFPTLPSVKDPRSHSHVADGLALLTQALSKFA